MAPVCAARHPLGVSVIRPLFQPQTYRDLLFLVVGIPIAAVVFGVLVAGWTSIAVAGDHTRSSSRCCSGTAVSSACLPAATRRWRDPSSARTSDPPTWSEGRGFWGRARAVFLDPSFWRQQAYLLLRMTIGFALGIAELSLIATAFGWITFPIWYRWVDTSYGSWDVDTLGRALLFVPAGIVALVAAAWAARGLGALSARQVRSLLGAKPAPTTPEALRRYRRRALWVDGGLASGLFLLTTIIWAATGAGYFWPDVGAAAARPALLDPPPRGAGGPEDPP